ncbi:serine/threonine-protein kinase [Sandaracinus amylolyticus]|uniref:serine/threonine-protein kinase n=1 Tax=Sandaracinus amylolyticus TaxID=927083 RepID=UPI001F3A0436|nr:serine/threonine-protein kinase [Sandaracinus amylolyticus]UJR83177.1 Hypothetical protein I5071_52430 [Sandaracinus amylolyticus]
MRRVVLAAVVLWVLVTATDALTAGRFWPERASELVMLRVVSAMLGIATWVYLRARGPAMSVVELRAATTFFFTMPCAFLSAMAALTGGVYSPYYGGVFAVVAIRGATVHEPWQTGAWTLAFPTLAYPVTMWIWSFIEPDVAAQLADPRTSAMLGFNTMNLVFAYGGLVVAGHWLWELRRQVFAARVLGRYRLVRKLGAGGMGEVWLARDAALRRDVALKILRVGRGQLTPHSVARFEREVRALVDLSHPNVVRVFDYGVSEDGIWYYVMEQLHGDTLVELAAREAPIGAARVVDLVAQAASALGEAHRRGIVHRDIKPANVFVTVTPEGRDVVKVLDFGIAKVDEPSSEASLTSTGVVLGTPSWFAPESVTGAPAGPPADVWGLGAVAYLLLTGHRPIEANGALEYASAVLQRAIPRPSEHLGAPMPRELEDIVMRCLARDPSDRFSDAEELVRALDALRLHETTSVSDAVSASV